MNIGKLIESKEEKDAIHIAIAPVIAYCDLKPGEHIGFIKDDNKTVSNLSGEKIGIVDPFLSDTVKRGQEFWMFLYPNTITSLRHNWTHPVFTRSIEESKLWIKDWAANYGISYDYAMQCGKERDFFIGDVCYDEIPLEFWNHYETITGEKVSESDKTIHFHCAC